MGDESQRNNCDGPKAMEDENVEVGESHEKKVHKINLSNKMLNLSSKGYAQKSKFIVGINYKYLIYSS